VRQQPNTGFLTLRKLTPGTAQAPALFSWAYTTSSSDINISPSFISLPCSPCVFNAEKVKSFHRAPLLQVKFFWLSVLLCDALLPGLCPEATGHRVVFFFFSPACGATNFGTFPRLLPTVQSPFRLLSFAHDSKNWSPPRNPLSLPLPVPANRLPQTRRLPDRCTFVAPASVFPRSCPCSLFFLWKEFRFLRQRPSIFP